ncbi:MAG: hypothetical protein Q8K86_09600, partial [Candidatus Nanopelagicaceae bacterium]|nr:hypothetical protein [Candidatus Nanopelagicaceae bacterium]
MIVKEAVLNHVKNEIERACPWTRFTNRSLSRPCWPTSHHALLNHQIPKYGLMSFFTDQRLSCLGLPDLVVSDDELLVSLNGLPGIYPVYRLKL